MDNHNSTPYQNKSSKGMATASLILGIIGTITCCCVYTPFVLGSLAIILALLSRGSEMSLSNYAIAGLILGVVSILFGMFVIFYYMVVAFASYGGFDSFFNDIYYNNGIYESYYNFL